MIGKSIVSSAWLYRLSLLAAAAIVIPACGRTLTATVVPFSIDNATLSSGVVGVTYTQTLTVSSATGAVTWSQFLGSLPPGLTLNAATGQITGTPTGSASTWVVIIRAIDAAGNVTQHSYLVSVTGGSPGALAVATASPMPGGDVGTPYDFGFAAFGGTGTYAWSVIGGALPTGLILNPANGGLTGIPTAAGTFNFTIQVNDGVSTVSQACQLTIASPMQITAATMPPGSVGGAYNRPSPVSNGSAPFLYSIAGGALPGGLSLNSATGVISGTPTTAATTGYTIRVTDAAGVSLLAGITHVINPAPIVTPIVLPPSTQGLAYSQTLAATLGTGAYSWAVTGGALPGGLSLSAVGVISGTSTVAGTFPFTVTVTDAANGTGSLGLSILINPPVTVTTTSFLGWTVNQPSYSQTAVATGGTGARTFSITGGTLPTGLTLNPATGAITGTPTVVGTSNFTVVATDTLGATGTKALSIVINLPPSISTTTLPDWTLSLAYTPVTVTVLNGTAPLGYSVTSGSLPAGLSLDSSTGVVNGTPTTAATSNFTITVVDAASASTNQAYTVVINPVNTLTTASPLAQWTQNKSGYSVSLGSSGGTGAKTFSVGAGLPGGLTLSSVGLISGNPTGAPTTYTFLVTVTDSVGATGSKSFDITINPPLAITTTSPIAPWTRDQGGYSATMAATGGTGAKTWSNPAGGTGLPAGLTLNAAGVLSGTPGATGTFTFNVQVTDTVLATAPAPVLLSLTINPPLAITTTSPVPPWTNGQAGYSQTLTATGGTGARTWTNPAGGTGLPAGMSVSSAGVLSGTPGATGTFTFNVQVTDTTLATAPSPVSLSITINPVPSITATSPLATWTQDLVGYNQSVTATGGTGALTWSNPGGGMPPGLTLNTSSGAITGKPTAAATYTPTFKVADTTGALSTGVVLTIVINPPLVITTSSLVAWDKDLAGYSQTLAATGGTGARTWSLSLGGIPSGLALNPSTGVISGQPDTAGSFPMTVHVTDFLGAGSAIDVSLPITINPPPSVTSTSPLAAWTKDKSGYSQILTGTGGTGALTWSVSTGSLPSGLSLNASTGAITGSPDTVATTVFGVKAKDTLNVSSAEVSLSITVNPVVTISTSSLASWTQNKSGYSQTVSGSGGTGALTWSVASGTFPPSLTLNPSTGAITGTPTDSPSLYSFTIQATDTVGATAVPSAKSLSITINPPINITSSTLAAWTQFQGGYNQSIVATGGTGTKTYAITGGSFPSSLSFNTSTGAITGAPNDSPGTYNFSVQVTDSIGANAGSPVLHSITINPPINFTGPTTLPAWTVGQSGYVASSNVTGGTGTKTWSLQGGSFPLGLFFDTSTGAMTGTPSTPTGLRSFDIRVQDSTGASNQLTFSIQLNSAIAITSTSPLPQATQGNLYNFQFFKSNGTDPVVWTTNLSNPDFSFSSGGLLSGTPSNGTPLSFNVTVTDAAGASATLSGASLTIIAPLQINTASLPPVTAGAGYVSGALAASGGSGGYIWSLLSGTPPGGIAFDSGGNWSGLAPGVNGVSTFVVKVQDSVGHVATKALSITVTGAGATSLAISTVSLPQGTQNATYLAGLTGTGGAGSYTWSLSGSSGPLPANLSISSAGVISGIPTSFATTPITVQLTDGSTTVTQALSIVINGPILITTGSPLPTWTVGRALSAGLGYPGALSNSGGTGTATWTAGSGLPTGVTLNSNGTFNGTPSATGSFVFTVTATDTVGATMSTSLNFPINPNPVVQNNFIPPGTQGVPFPVFSMAVQPFTGTGPFAWTSNPVSLPFGVSMSGSGSFTGTPSSSGSQSIDFTVTDASGATAPKTLNLVVNSPPSITTISLPDGSANIPYPSQQINVSNGTPSFTYSINGGSLPTGMSLSGSGLVSGTPTVSGPFSVTIKATDANSAFATKTFGFNITTGPTVSTANPPNSSTQVYLSTNMVLTFNQPMNKALTEAAITFGATPISTPTPTAAYFWDGTSTILTIVFETNGIPGIQTDDLLTQSSTYTVTVGTGAQSQSGTPMSVPYSTSFDTILDGTIPHIASFSPPLTSLIPSGTNQIDVVFDKDMDPTRGEAQVQFGFDGNKLQGDIQNPGSNVGMSVSWFTSKIFRMTFTVPLPDRSVYRLDLNNFYDSASPSHSLANNQELVFVTANSVAETTHPIVTGTLPGNGATLVPPDTGIFVAFSEPMDPDVINHVTVTGATGVTFTKSLNDSPMGVQFQSDSALPGGATITITWDAGAKDARGNTLVAGSATFTVDSSDSTPPAVDAAFSSFPTAPNNTDVSSYGFGSEINFVKNATTTRDYVNAKTLTTADVSIFDSSTLIPVKGYSISVSDSGGLRFDTQSNFLGLTNGATYTLRLNTSLKNTSGIAIAQTDLPFTVASSPSNARPSFYSSPVRSKFTTKAGPAVKTKLQLDFNDNGQTITSVVAQDLTDTLFHPALLNGGNGYSYNSSGTEANLSTPGVHILTYTILDAAAHTTPLNDKAFVFATVPTSVLPSGSTGASTTPTYSWSGVPATASALFVQVQESLTGNTVYQAIMSPGLTSFAQPADYPLTSGVTYKWSVQVIHFMDAGLRGGGDQGGASNQQTFTVP